MRIAWRTSARADMLDIAEYIDIDNPAAALAVVEDIHHQIARLTLYPKMGRAGRIEATRELVIRRTPFIAVYTIEPEAVVILRVLHGAQRWPR
ncbi:type II toxin-antitoxin system RelE/ParE family toxin [Marinivivus vitaminiproducens]|uniref:type II toxin-antitoxin system RelE/ParE family toxin n=1 Tax=Marinivivus vitaminiproducens TaxID=3035935 RepID=UPI00279DF7BD|nr:type II toxin-antitoxin system RelE/ParE family toxin [Geminicoccaceae bacterium SCSIO 64248]